MMQGGKKKSGNERQGAYVVVCVLCRNDGMGGGGVDAWVFMRGAIILRAPRHSKWRTAFVCLVTYWLVVVQLFVL